MGGLRVSAQVPPWIQYQGRVLVEGVPYHGPGLFKFVLGGADEAAVFWANAPVMDGVPDTEVSIPVVRGLFSVFLGDTTLDGMAPLDPAVFQAEDVFLRVWFSDGEGPFERLLPDSRMVSVGYAFLAASVAPGGVTLDALAPGVLATSNLQGTLSESQLPEGLVWETGLSSILAAWQTQFDQLALQTQSLSNQVQALEDAVAGGGAPGSGDRLAVSRDPTDPDLLADGFVRFHSVPAGRWEAVSGINAPGARVGHVTVQAASQMIVWGGRIGVGANYSNAGHRYDPDNDIWTLLSLVDAPTARMNATGAVYPDGFIVWGGVGVTGFLGTGGRYSFNTGNWSPTTTEDAPSAREGHVAVWTGSRFLVWGGRNATGLLADGGAYDPVANTWTALPAMNAPSARQGARAVFAGDRLLVWGGEGESGVLGDGAQLLLDAAGVPVSWAGLTSTGAPSGRVDHALVWTGDRMLLWGGRAGGSFLGGGAQYDPVGNSWTPLPSPGEALTPAGRGGHLMAWTGSELLVFGGATVDGATATGAALDVGTGIWRSLPSIDDPVARVHAGGIWTGKSWVLFGGESNGTLVGAPRRLDPEPAWHFFRKP